MNGNEISVQTADEKKRERKANERTNEQTAKLKSLDENDFNVFFFCRPLFFGWKYKYNNAFAVQYSDQLAFNLIIITIIISLVLSAIEQMLELDCSRNSPICLSRSLHCLFRVVFFPFFPSVLFVWFFFRFFIDEIYDS